MQQDQLKVPLYPVRYGGVSARPWDTRSPVVDAGPSSEIA